LKIKYFDTVTKIKVNRWMYQIFDEQSTVIYRKTGKKKTGSWWNRKPVRICPKGYA